MRRPAQRYVLPALLGLLVLLGVLVAAELPVGTTLAGQVFEWQDDFDVRSDGAYGQFEIELAAGVEYRMSTADALGGTTRDPYLYLLDASETIVAQDDDSGPGLEPLIVYTPSVDGTFLLRLRAYSRGRAGTCSLSVQGGELPEETQVPYLPGETYADQSFGWRDGFAAREEGTYFEHEVGMVAGGAYRFEVLAATGDTYLYLVDSAGAILAQDDDGGAGLLSLLTFTAPGAGTARLRLRSYRRDDEGTCTVRVSAVEPPEPDPDPDPDPDPGGEHPTLLPGDHLDGQAFGWRTAFAVRSDGDYFQYRILMFGNQDYTFETHDARGANADTYLYLVDEAGALLASDDDGGAGYHSSLTYNSPTTAWHHLRLRSYGRGLEGTCELHVHTEAGDPADTIPVINRGDVLNGVTFAWRAGESTRPGGEYGHYQVDMSAGETYVFETSNAVGGNGDTYLYLVDEDGDVVVADDDGGPGYLSRLSHAPGVGGTYYLRLRAYRRGASGTCTLRALGSGEAGTPLLPDLTPWVMEDSLLDAHISREGGRKLLRFGNAAANRGSGPLEMYGVVNDQTGETDAFQVVHNDNGTRAVHHVGTFIFHDHENHNHWHFDEFAAYQLRDADTDEILRTSGKVSFCLLDAVRYTAESVPDTPPRGHYTCDDQGISVGWVDIYEADIEGQSLDVTDLPDGTYKLVSIVDPAGRLQESNRSNNTAEVEVTISGNAVTVRR